MTLANLGTIDYLCRTKQKTFLTAEKMLCHRDEKGLSPR